MDVEQLLDVGDGDELGTPDAALVECDCGVIHRRGDETHAEVCDE